MKVGHKDLIAALRGALRAAELQGQVDRQKAETADLVAATRARELLACRGEDAAPRSDADLLTDLPLTTTGSLHEPAFLALADARVWERREQQFATLTQPSNHDQEHR